MKVSEGRVDRRVEFARLEQAALWRELSDAIRTGINTTWSMRASAIAGRIVAAARIAGPTPYTEVPWSLVAGGVYAAVLATAAIERELPGDADLCRFEEQIGDGETREEAAARLAGAVAAIRTPRETAWISGDDG